MREYGFEVDPTLPIDENSVFVNDIAIRRTEEADDAVSVIFRTVRPLPKRLLHDATPFTGVEVRADKTVVFGFFPLGGALNDLDNIVINGETISGFNVLNGDADKRLRNEINGRTEMTGVTAFLDDQQNLLLEAEDGRNIELETSSFEAASITGLNNGFPGVEVYGAALQFLSRDSFEVNLQGLDMDFSVGIGPGNGRHGFGLDDRHALGTIDITNPEEAQRSVEIADVAIEEVTQTRDELNGVLTQLRSNLFSSENHKIHLELSRQRIQDTDVLSEVAISREITSSKMQVHRFFPRQTLSKIQPSTCSKTSRAHASCQATHWAVSAATKLNIKPRRERFALQPVEQPMGLIKVPSRRHFQSSATRTTKRFPWGGDAHSGATECQIPPASPSPRSPTG